MALLIYENIAQTRDSNCTVKAGQTATVFRPQGVLDISLTTRYTMFPHFRNLMPTIETLTGESVKGLSAETHTMTIKGAHVRLDMGMLCPYNSDWDSCCVYDPEYDTCDIPLTARDNGKANGKENLDLKPFITDGFFYPASSTVTPLQDGVTSIEVIPPELGLMIYQKLATQIINLKTPYPSLWITAYVQLAAETQDKLPIHSNVFAYPIEICVGCLIWQFADNLSAGDLPCRIGQDDAISNALCEVLGVGAPAKITGQGDCDVCFPTMNTCGWGCNDLVPPKDPACVKP
jgi:hypothetical protein